LIIQQSLGHSLAKYIAGTLEANVWKFPRATSLGFGDEVLAKTLELGGTGGDGAGHLEIKKLEIAEPRAPSLEERMSDAA